MIQFHGFHPWLQSAAPPGRNPPLAVLLPPPPLADTFFPLCFGPASAFAASQIACVLRRL
jgi:hypothetical protein